MKFYIKTFLFFLMSFSYCISQEHLHTETIDGPANVRLVPNGKVLFELYDNTRVSSTRLKDNWFEVALFVKTSGKNKNSLDVGEFIYSIDGKKIGLVLKNTSLFLKDENRNLALISGYTYKNNIKKELIPEVMLFDLIEQRKHKTKEDFNSFLKKYHFELYSKHEYLLPEIDMYTISESIIYDITPTFRISLLFKENKIIGVVHTRNFKLSNSESYNLIRGQKLTLVNKSLSVHYIEKLKASLMLFFEKAD